MLGRCCCDSAQQHRILRVHAHKRSLHGTLPLCARLVVNFTPEGSFNCKYICDGQRTSFCWPSLVCLQPVRLALLALASASALGFVGLQPVRLALHSASALGFVGPAFSQCAWRISIEDGPEVQRQHNVQRTVRLRRVGVVTGHSYTDR